MNGGCCLTCAVCVMVLTYALTAFSSSHGSENPNMIVQVTDDQYRNPGNNYNLLLGTQTELEFKSFMREYGKDYQTTDEYVRRLAVFAANLARAARHQVADPTAVHGVTQFSDMEPEEFERTFMGMRVGGGEGNGVVGEEIKVERLPKRFDWREKGAVTDVKMQGTCGSCWAFSTTGALEGANFIAKGKLLNLSEQQLVDCDHTCDPKDRSACDNGCNGGLMTNAYKYLMEVGGIEEEQVYPYTGERGECKFNPEKVAVRVSNFTNIPIDEKQIAAYLVRHGPLAVGLNALFMQTYIRGVSCPLICGKKWLNHGVLLVGYGSKGFSILRLGNQPYWIIKNSWGKRWGEHGYYRLCKGHGMCGMNTMVSAVMTRV